MNYLKNLLFILEKEILKYLMKKYYKEVFIAFKNKRRRYDKRNYQYLKQQKSVKGAVKAVGKAAAKEAAEKATQNVLNITQVFSKRRQGVYNKSIKNFRFCHNGFTQTELWQQLCPVQRYLLIQRQFKQQIKYSKKRAASSN